MRDGIPNQNKLSPFVPASFARQLERENAALVKERDVLTGRLMVADAAFEEWTKANSDLRATLAERDRDNELLMREQNVMTELIQSLRAQLADTERKWDSVRQTIYREESLAAAIEWLERWFYENSQFDGNGNHACPWCYCHEGQKPWRDIKHSSDCIIGHALSSQPDLPLIEEVRDAAEETATIFDELDTVQWDENGCPVTYQGAQEKIIRLLARLNPRK